MARMSVAGIAMILTGGLFMFVKMLSLFEMPYWYILPVFGLIAIYATFSKKIK